jgi:hypothetical protein
VRKEKKRQRSNTPVFISVDDSACVCICVTFLASDTGRKKEIMACSFDGVAPPHETVVEAAPMRDFGFFLPFTVVHFKVSATQAPTLHTHTT